MCWFRRNGGSEILMMGLTYATIDKCAPGSFLPPSIPGTFRLGAEFNRLSTAPLDNLSIIPDNIIQAKQLEGRGLLTIKEVDRHQGEPGVEPIDGFFVDQVVINGNATWIHDRNGDTCRHLADLDRGIVLEARIDIG